MKAPDVKKHLAISLVKSALRILGCFIALTTGNIYTPAFLFLFAELLGVAEELF